MCLYKALQVAFSVVMHAGLMYSMSCFLFVTDISFLEVNVLTECEDRLLQTCQTCQIVLCIFVVEKLSYSA